MELPYGEEGYHPQLCYNSLTGDLIRAELRDGTDYCSKDVLPLWNRFSVNLQWIIRLQICLSGATADMQRQNCIWHVKNTAPSML